MANGKKINIYCQCGTHLFTYFKGGHGRLIKCFLDRLIEDHVGISELPTHATPHCPNCDKKLGDIRLVRGKPALKLNQGAIQKIRT